MSNRLASYLIAGALASALALVSPALAQRAGGGGGGGHAIGGGGGFGGGRAIGGGGGFGGARVSGTGIGPRTGGMVGPHFGGARFAGTPFAARAAFVPGQRFAFHPGFHHRFFHRRFHRFAFFGAPFVYAAYNYDYCWRRVWTRYGLQWVNVCYDYGY